MNNYVLNVLNEWVRNAAAKFGYNIDVRKIKPGSFPSHVDDEFAILMKLVREYSLLPWEASFMNYQAAKWVATQGIPGDVVECGVFKGGSIVMFAKVFERLDKDFKNRKFWLFDTFEGMAPPTERDASDAGPADKEYRMSLKKDGTSGWCRQPLEEVEAYIRRNTENLNVVYVKGKVEETLAKDVNRPERIAILRLDTDFYESTKAEMEFLYPRLVPNGVLIVDDYSFWKGCKEAVDEFFAANNIKPSFFLDPQSGRVMHFKAQT